MGCDKQAAWASEGLFSGGDNGGFFPVGGQKDFFQGKPTSVFPVGEQNDFYQGGQH